MNFKKLEVFGFKSFADKLEVKFDNGITAIVGPNGCGKSNVADSLRWVMGEQSAKTLRGSSMADLIFSGTEKRKSLSYCEVSLFFDNSNRIFNLDYDEVVLTRKLYRDGASEYLINRTNCRLKDIQDLLRDSGLGRDGYSIIGQGKIDEILSNKPEDRRAIFEEAAGVSRFKVRKVEAERKLIRTKENIERLTDIIDELERQLEPLTKQAEAARKFLDLKEKLKHYEVNTYIYQYETAAEAKQIVRNKLSGIIEEITVKTIDCEKATVGYEKAMSEIGGLDKTIEELREELLNLTVGIEQQAGELKLLREKLGYMNSENIRLTEEIKKLNSDYEHAVAELEGSVHKREGSVKKADSLREKIEKLNEQYFSIVDKLTLGEGETEEHNRMVMEAMNKLSDIKANMSRLLAERTALTEKNDELTRRIAAIKAKAKDDSDRADSIGKDITVLDGKTADLKLRADGLVNIHNDALAKVQSLAAEIDKLSAIFHTKSAHHRFLSQMQSEFEGYQASVKRLLQDAQKDKSIADRMEGVIAQLVKVPEKYETAVETALGSALQNIITRTDDDAKFLINYLKSRNYGRVTFQPISTVKPRRFEDQFKGLLKRGGCHGIAVDLIDFDKKYYNVFSSLLGGTVVVDTIDDAVLLARDCDYAFRIVTLEGDITFPGGAITGGSRKAELNNILGAERELKKLTDELADNKLSLDKRIKDREDYAAAQKKASEDIKKVNDELHSKELLLATEREKHSKLSAGLEDLNRELFVLDQEAAGVTLRLSEIKNDLDSVEKYEYIIQSEKENASENRIARRQQYDTLRKEREEIHENLTELKVVLASVEGEVSALDADIVRIKQHIVDTTAEIDAASEQMNNNISTIEYAEKGIRDFERSVSGNGKERVIEIREQLANLDKYKQDLQEKMSKFDADRIYLLNFLNKLNDDKAREEFLLEKVDSDIATMQERIEEEYELTYEMCLPYKEEEYDMNKGVQESNRLKRQIQNLGYVNVNAIEDSKIIGERYYEKVAQRDDLAKAEADLVKIIGELTKEMISRFNTEFNKIAENFVKVFRELFGGGNASLLLLESDDPLEAGIEIVAEPPGKKLQSISLLSGGERALTAIAILFSILKLKPMPFCVLDEIEAALDDANAQRFAKYLHRFSQSTQFIVITHRKPTMELADNLYGVTMEEKGVSKIVSVKLSDAVRVAEQTK